jgi:hypothetical protein
MGDTVTKNKAGFSPEDFGDFVFIPDFLDKIQELADMAEEEDWRYKDSSFNKPGHPNPMLENYLSYSYKRLVEERKIKISDDKNSTCLNTGLLSRNNQEEIYLLMSKNFLPDKKQYWHFGKFVKGSNKDLLITFGGKLPDMCEYFTDPTVLMFDARKEIEIDYDHIIDDNFERFPENIQLRDKYEVRNLLFAATNRIRERIKRNYKIAVPHCFHGSIQFLIPVCLTSPKKADVALVVEKVADKSGNYFYRGNTILPLDFAYNSARQIARPSQEWLVP